MRFSHSTCFRMLPVFVCDLSHNIECIFGLDARREIGFILHFGKGVCGVRMPMKHMNDLRACLPRK